MWLRSSAYQYPQTHTAIRFILMKVTTVAPEVF